MARRTVTLRKWYERVEKREEEVDVITWLAIPGQSYRSDWDGRQVVSSSHVVAVVVRPNGEYMEVGVDSLRRVVRDGA